MSAMDPAGILPRSPFATSSSRTDGDDDGQGGSSPKRRKRNTKHTSRACDVCKGRKTRCDGRQPRCGHCTMRDVACTWTKEDGRRHRKDGSTLRDRIGTLIDLIGSRPDLLRPQQELEQALDSAAAMFADQPGPDLDLDAMDPDDCAAMADFVVTPMRPTSSPASAMALPPAAATVLPETAHLAAAPASTGAGSMQSDRLKRTEPGALMQFGPTSLWSYAPDRTRPAVPSLTSAIDMRSGDWVDWARNLPPDLCITKSEHDGALAYFAAYYAPWCMITDMPAFLRDLDACNLVTRVPRDPPPPRKTASYSPLLHVCALHIGLHLGRELWPSATAFMGQALNAHCAPMLLAETEEPSACTPLALALFASCLNIRRESSASSTGYTYFGMALAAVQALGVNLNCDQLVSRGHLNDEERNQRYATCWTIFQQDVLRAIAAGRPAMLTQPAHLPFPDISPAADSGLWLEPPAAQLSKAPSMANGMKSMASSVQHWNVRLHCILRKLLGTSLYSVEADAADRDTKAVAIWAELDAWYRAQPFANPAAYPLPHLIVMHMVYQLTTMYLFRPYYRAELPGMDDDPSVKCDAAAETCLHLLRLYEQQHGLKHGPGTIIPVVFTTATLQLLRLVSMQGDQQSDLEHVGRLDEICGLMSTLSTTWLEAKRGLEVINSLRTEWLPKTIDADVVLPLADLTLPFSDQSTELPRELHEWLLNADGYDFTTW